MTHGRRRIVPILGGTVQGPMLKAKVVPGGADWQMIQADGFTELDTRYTLETEQGRSYTCRTPASATPRPT